MKDPLRRIHLRCIVCGTPLDRRGEICARRECVAAKIDTEALLLTQFILTGMRFSGGAGWGIDKAEIRGRMEKAIAELPRDAESLAVLLVELLESGQPPVLYPGWGAWK